MRAGKNTSGRTFRFNPRRASDPGQPFAHGPGRGGPGPSRARAALVGPTRNGAVVACRDTIGTLKE